VTSDLPSGQPIGTKITFTATSTNTDPTEFRFSVKGPAQPIRIVYDFAPENVFTWTAIEEGGHVILVSARNMTTGTIEQTAQLFFLTPLGFSAPVVTSTSHPLVALYSFPTCYVGTVRVLFRRSGGGQTYMTHVKPCVPGRSNNFYIAGMAENTEYLMYYQRLVGPFVVETGPNSVFTTGLIPADVLAAIPTTTVIDPPEAGSSPETILLQSPLPVGPVPRFPFATDRGGTVVWYANHAASRGAMLFRPITGGTMTVAMKGTNGINDQVLQEFDLAGNVIRQTTAPRVSEQLVAMGKDPLTSFHHEALRLPNGHTAVIGSIERILTDVQGPGPVDVLADYIVVLDTNWQVVWSWNGFDHLDVTRLATLNETCVHQGPGCPPLFSGTLANDWMHSNGVAYSADDGSLLLSIRHQDWVIKIDYANGAGDGHVIWRLGPGGDFTTPLPDVYPFFSHQHDPNFRDGTTIAVYDNGNTRCAQVGDCVSRGQVWQVNETTMTAIRVLNADLGNYSAALGSAQPLFNGNYHFNSGFQTPPTFTGTSDEILPDGSKANTYGVNSGIYRSFRMFSLHLNLAN
jgi:hypothetical protein